MWGLGSFVGGLQGCRGLSDLIKKLSLDPCYCLQSKSYIARNIKAGPTKTTRYPVHGNGSEHSHRRSAVVLVKDERPDVDGRGLYRVIGVDMGNPPWGSSMNSTRYDV